MSVLINANALHIPLADESVHLCVTSPPYWGLRKYSGGQAYIWGGDPNCAHEWDNHTRVFQTGGKSEKQMSNAGVNGSGWIADDSRCLKCSAWYGELGLEPTIEQFIENMVAVFREVKRVLRNDGTLFMNISDTRTKDRQWYGIPHKLVFAMVEDGWRYEDEVIWHKPNPMPGSQTNRFTRSHEFMFMLNKNTDAFFDAVAVMENAKQAGRIQSPGSRPNGINPDRNDNDFAERNKGKVFNSRNRRSVWTIPTSGFSGAHFATYPPALVEPCIKAGTSEAGCCSAKVKMLRVKNNLNPEQQKRVERWLKRKGLL